MFRSACHLVASSAFVLSCFQFLVKACRHHPLGVSAAFVVDLQVPWLWSPAVEQTLLMPTLGFICCRFVGSSCCRDVCRPLVHHPLAVGVAWLFPCGSQSCSRFVAWDFVCCGACNENGLMRIIRVQAQHFAAVMRITFKPPAFRKAVSHQENSPFPRTSISATGWFYRYTCMYTHQ